MKEKNLLPQSVQVGNMVLLPTPCGDVAFYPMALAMKGQVLKQYSVFMITSHKSNISYLVVTLDSEAKYKLAGKYEDIERIYEGLPWDEVIYEDNNDVFYYKEVPSGVNVDDYFKWFNNGA